MHTSCLQTSASPARRSTRRTGLREHWRGLEAGSTAVHSQSCSTLPVHKPILTYTSCALINNAVHFLYISQ